MNDEKQLEALNRIADGLFAVANAIAGRTASGSVSYGNRGVAWEIGRDGYVGGGGAGAPGRMEHTGESRGAVSGSTEKEETSQ